MVIGCGQQFNCKPSGLHPSCRVDPGPDLEYDVVDRKMSRLKFGEGCHRKEPLAGVLIELLQAEMGQHPVLPDHGHEVGGNADHQEVQQRDQGLERDAVFLGICLYELEAHTAT